MRLIRSTALRLVQEGEGEESLLKVYYSTENTREYHEAGEQWLEVSTLSNQDQCCGAGVGLRWPEPGFHILSVQALN